MTKDKLLLLVQKLGFDYQKTEKSENGSVYLCFKNTDEHSIWIGSTFLESEFCAFALDYKRSNKDEIIKFIHNGGI